MATSSNYFASTNTNTLKGGLQQVETYDDLYGISDARLQDGMLVYVVRKGIYYAYDVSTQHWKESNIRVCDGQYKDVTIDGQTYTIFAQKDFYKLLQSLIQTKYSLEQQQELIEQSLSCSPLYYEQLSEFQQYAYECKKIAHLMIYGTSYPPDEDDTDNKLTYPILMSMFDDIRQSIAQLKVLVTQNDVDYLKIVPDASIIAYEGPDKYHVFLSAKGLEYPIKSNTISLDTIENVICQSTNTISDFEYVIEKPKVGEYTFIYNVIYEGGYLSQTQQKSISFVNPFIYGFSTYSDTNDNLFVEDLKYSLTAINEVVDDTQTDGMYFWICVPNETQVPIITNMDTPFPLSLTHYTYTTQNCTYTCYRSCGEYGLENGHFHLNVVYKKAK